VTTVSISRKAKLTFGIKKFFSFIAGLRRNKRGLFGIGIIVFYTTIGLAAPLLTPNDPSLGYYVSADYAMPSWFKYFTSEGLIEDVRPIEEPGFTSASVFSEWNFTTTASASCNVSRRYVPNIGRPVNVSGSGPGSAGIVFYRTDPAIAARTVTATLTNKFYYTYKNPPKRFAGSVVVMASNTEEVPVEVRIYIANSSGYKFYFWRTEGEITADWVVPEPPVDSYESELRTRIEKMTGQIGADPAAVLFPTQGYYTYGLEIIFDDNTAERFGETVAVYIDDLNLRLYGNIYGVLGTDHQGRDLFAQLLYGARISLFVGLLAAVVSVVIGLFVGLVAGYLGKAMDELLMRLTDALLVLPSLPLLLVLIALLGPSIWNLITVIGVLGWMGFARTVRSQALSLKERPFVEAAKAVGAGRWHIIVKHILPNVMSLVYVSLALSVPTAILSEAALSWLGLFDPSVVSWGRMLHDAQEFYGVERWWWVVPPGLSIALVSLSFILIGYALDEILNPKLRQRR